MKELKGLQIALEMLKRESAQGIRVHEVQEGTKLTGFTSIGKQISVYSGNGELLIYYKDKLIEKYKDWKYEEQFSQELKCIMEGKKDELKNEFYRLLDEK